MKVFKTLFAMPAQLDSGGRFAWSINDDGPKSLTLVKVGPVMMASLSILETMAIVVSRLVRGLIAVSRALASRIGSIASAGNFLDAVDARETASARSGLPA